MSEENNDKKNIVILGGSYAGLAAAHYFLKHVLPSLDDTYHVYLVNPSTKFYHRVAAPRAAVSFKLMPEAKTFHDIPQAFKQYKPETFTFTQGKATSLDTGKRVVTIQMTDGTEASKTLPYHALILATGTKTHSTALSSHDGPHEDVMAALTTLQKQIETAKSVVVVGGGPAGVETAGEIGEFLNGAAGFFAKKPANPKATVTLVSGAEKLLPVLRPALSKQAEVYLARVGVDVLHNSKMEKTEKIDGDRTKVTLSDGQTLECDVYIPAMGVIPMTEYVPKNLLNEKGYIQVNEETLRVEGAGDRVYAVGDVGSYTRGGIMDIYDAIPVVMTNVKRDVLAYHKEVDSKPTGADRKYKKNTSETQVVPVGRSKGVGAFNGNRLPSIMVYMIKGRDYLSGAGLEAVNGTKWNKETGWKPTDG